MPDAAEGAEAGDDRSAFRFPRSARVTRGPEIRALFRRGQRFRTPHLDLFVAPASLPHPRFGMVVPKHRHGSVERNLVKRRLREIARTLVLPRLRAEGHARDVLVRARPEAYAAPFAALRDGVAAIMDRLCSRAP